MRLETISVFARCATLLYLSSLVRDFTDRESGVKTDKNKVKRRFRWLFTLNVIHTSRACSWINITHLLLSDFRGSVVAILVDSNLVPLATKDDDPGIVMRNLRIYTIPIT